MRSKRRLEPANRRRPGEVLRPAWPYSFLREQSQSEKSQGGWGTGPPVTSTSKPQPIAPHATRSLSMGKRDHFSIDKRGHTHQALRWNKPHLKACTLTLKIELPDRCFGRNGRQWGRPQPVESGNQAANHDD